MMKKLFLCFILALSLCGCGSADAKTEEPAVPTFKYTQFASGGVSTELDAIILFENANSTFTRYQISYTSCTCRDAASNYRSVVYVEILNTKDTADEALIRSISFSTNDNYSVGFWGDSNPIYGQPEYTLEYMDENFIQKLVGLSKADFDNWAGYGKSLVGVDTLSGATVSCGNLISLLQGLMAYHGEKYYTSK